MILKIWINTLNVSFRTTSVYAYAQQERAISSMPVIAGWNLAASVPFKRVYSKIPAPSMIEKEGRGCKGSLAEGKPLSQHWKEMKMLLQKS